MPSTSGNDTIYGSPFMDTIDPLGGDDVMYGYQGRDVFYASPGTDTIYGAAGDPGPVIPSGYIFDIDIDTLIYHSARSEMVLQSAGFSGWWGQMFPFNSVSGWQTTTPLEGTEKFLGVERLVFAGGQALALDIGYMSGGQDHLGNAGKAAKLVAALLGAPAMADEVTVGLALAALDRGVSEAYLAGLALEYLGVSSHEDVVRLLWNNVVGVPITDGYLSQFIALLDGGMAIADLAVLASNASYNTDRIHLTGAPFHGPLLADTGLHYQYFPVAVAPRVVSVIGGTAVEGTDIVSTITLSTPTTEAQTLFPIDLFGGTANAADLGAMSATNGVTIADGQLVIGPGVLSFDLIILAVDDAVDEVDEIFHISAGYVAGTATILDNDGPVFVRTVSQPIVVEGADMAFVVQLSGPAPAAAQLNFAFSCDVGIADWATLAFTNGVTQQGDKLLVPTGVSGFSVVVGTHDDTWYQPGAYVYVTIDGIGGSGAVLENDPKPHPDESFFGGGVRLNGLGSNLRLDTEQGLLSTAALRTAIITATSEADYWKLFTLDLVKGPHDGVWLPEELGGYGFGYMHATLDNLQSLIFGTHVELRRHGTDEEIQALRVYAADNRDAIRADSLHETNHYVDSVLAMHFYDDPVFTQEQLAANVVSYFTGLVHIVAAGGTVEMLDMFQIGWH